MQERTRLPAPRRTIDRRIVGNRQYVTAAIQRLQAQRRLVHCTPWTETPEGVTVTVRILEPTEPAPAPAPAPATRRRWAVPAAVTGVGLTVLGVAGYALIRLVDALIAVLPVIGGALFLLALAALFVRGRSSGTFTFTGTGRMD